jgi:hypothetical protein
MKRRPAHKTPLTAMWVWRQAATILGALGVAWVGACAGSSTQLRPVANLASSTRAGSAFEHLREEWIRSTDANRHVLRRDLEAFVNDFPGDGLAPLARLYAVLAWMSPPQDWARAEAILRATSDPPPGTSHDLYLVALAKDLRHHHDPDAAFDLLRPLVGKMVDGASRGLLEEEVSLDALESHRDYEAIAYMDAWIRGASEEGRDAVLAKVSKVLTQLPEQALAGSLRAMRASGASHGYGAEIERLVAERIANIAVERGDPSLARWLLDPDAGAATIPGKVGVELGELATSKRGLGNVIGRTVGLVLPTHSAELRGAAADVVRGMAWALELPRGDPSGGDRVRLVTRDDTGEPEQLISSLEEIAGEGASIIVTGLDVTSADRALEWADAKQIALLLLAAPSAAHRGSFVFALGQPLAPVIQALLGAAKPPQNKGGGLVAPIVEGDAAKFFVEGFTFETAVRWRAPVPCDVRSAKAGQPRFPVASWRASGVHTWLLASSPECARDVIHEVTASGDGGVFALALEAAGVTEHAGPGVRLLAAATGIVPWQAAPPGDARTVDAQAMVARSGGYPSWWAALGHDAGVLSRRALSTLPLDTVTAAADISRRRREARDALARARAPLWTADAEGFDAAVGGSADGHAPKEDDEAHEMRRTIRVIDLGK